MIIQTCIGSTDCQYSFIMCLRHNDITSQLHACTCILVRYTQSERCKYQVIH